MVIKLANHNKRFTLAWLRKGRPLSWNPRGHAILALTQVSYFEDGTAFEYVKSQYVGERFEFYLENN